MEFPYQLTTFLAAEPEPGEPVYSGLYGWYAQVALKRRFGLNGISEEELIQKLSEYCKQVAPIPIRNGGVVQLERMPVRVIEVESSAALTDFHMGFIKIMDDLIKSRYPERDGKNYLPHITTEYNGRTVININQFTHRKHLVDEVWLLKDIDDENSRALQPFSLTKS